MTIFKIQNKLTIEKMEMSRTTRPRMIWQYSGHIDIWNALLIELYDAACIAWYESYLMLEILKMFLMNEKFKIPMENRTMTRGIQKNICDFILVTRWR